jgi:hypothetical protein
VAHGIVGAAAEQGRRHRTGQQDRADGVGDDGQGRALQGTGRACGVNEIAPDIRRDVKLAGRTARNAEPVDPAIGRGPYTSTHGTKRTW